jgi:hypothetical protein
MKTYSQKEVAAWLGVGKHRLRTYLETVWGEGAGAEVFYLAADDCEHLLRVHRARLAERYQDVRDAIEELEACQHDLTLTDLCNALPGRFNTNAANVKAIWTPRYPGERIPPAKLRAVLLRYNRWYGEPVADADALRVADLTGTTEESSAVGAAK